MSNLPKYIAHTADIHIGHPRRDEEYENVFRGFAASLPPAADTIVVIAGDIFHHKTRYSGTDVHLFNVLMDLLADYEVIIVPGNHDANMNNLHEMDLITPVMEKGNFPNVHYWKYTGAYTLRGLKFYHVSVFGNIVPGGDDLTHDTLPPLTSAGIREVASPDTILLYHGVVNGAVYGTQIGSERLITREVMTSFGAVMLGDIHQQQHLLPTAAYPGSLIQQNVAESQDKGYLLWDVSRWPEVITSRHIPVANNSGFVKMDFRGMSADEIAALIESRPLHDKMLKISVLTDDDAPADHLAAVEAKFGRIDVIKKSSAEGISATVVGECLRGLLLGSGMDEQSVEICVQDYLSQVVTVARGRWYIRRLEWSNLFKYGEGNVIDFGKLSSHHGISGVIAGNHRGKSSIFDIIAFGLFNEHLRGKSVQDIIRKEASCSRVSVEFATGGDVWRVTRTDNRGRHLDLKLHRQDTAADGTTTWTNCTAESAPGTYAAIVRLIGTFTQMMATGMYYDIGYELTRKKPADSLNMMTGLIGLDSNDKISAALDDSISKLNKQIAGLTKPRVSDDSAVLRLREVIDAETSAQVIDEATLDAELLRLMEYRRNAPPTVDIAAIRGRLVAIERELDTIEISSEQFDHAPVWRESWKVIPTATHADMLAADEISAGGSLDAIRTRVDALAIDAAVAAAGVESMKMQIKSRGNPDVVSKIPALSAECARLASIATVESTSGPSGSREELTTAIARIDNELLQNKLLPVDTANETTLKRSLQMVEADITKLQTAADASAERYRVKISGIVAQMAEMNVGEDTKAQLIADGKRITAEIDIAHGSLKLVEHDALAMHVAGLRMKSGLQFADGCTACAANKSTFCDGLSTSEARLATIARENREAARRIEELQGVFKNISDRLAVVNAREMLSIELENTRATAARTAESASAQMTALRTRRDEWLAALEACTAANEAAGAENSVRASETERLSAERARLGVQLRELDAWTARYHDAELARARLDVVRGELAGAESMLDLIKQYGTASTTAKEITGELARLQTGLELVKRCEDVREYDRYIRWQSHNDAVERRVVLSTERDELLAVADAYDASADAIESLRACEESVRGLRAAITNRAVAIGVARRDLDAADAEVVILREYERSYPVLRDKLEMNKKYRAVVKSGGLKAGVVKRYLDVIVERANDMLRSVSAGFILTCGVDSAGVAFGFREGARELSLALASGFQRFISALTFRMALISVLPSSPAFMMIDEGFGCMDDTNLLHAIEFLETCVLRDYEFVFVISHKEELRNTIRSPLSILGDDVSLLNNVQVSTVAPNTPANNPAVHIVAIAPRADGLGGQTCAQAGVQTGAQTGVQTPADSRIQCECGALVLKKSMKAHLNSARHKNPKK